MFFGYYLSCLTLFFVTFVLYAILKWRLILKILEWKPASHISNMIQRCVQMGKPSQGTLTGEPFRGKIIKKVYKNGIKLKFIACAFFKPLIIGHTLPPGHPHPPGQRLQKHLNHSLGFLNPCASSYEKDSQMAFKI